ncbi:MAG: metallophosphoesterase family protein [Armatimonadetes bacterium]|nr:metallophosphoesterase family protein [Armatimonadota bacterium]
MWLLHLVVGILGAVLAVWIFGQATYSWGVARARVSVAPARRGETTIALTPVGEVTARTHRVPVRVVVALERLNLPALRRMAQDLPDAGTVVADLERRAVGSAGHYALRLLLLALMGGILASALLLRGWHWGHLLAGVGGALAVGLLLLGAARTFDRSAFASPRYTGPLAEAPGAIRFARDGLARLSRLRGKMDNIAESLRAFYTSLGDSGARLPREEDLRVLHVSDIHNNPIAVDFIRQFTRRFRIDLIANTGDLTDYGTEVEDTVLRPLGELDVPQLFVAGNHDSQTTVRAVDRLPRVRALDGEMARVAGLRVVGWGDPVSQRTGYGSVDPTPGDLDALERRIRKGLAELPEPPDIALVHSHRVAQRLEGLVSVVLYGHDHRPGVRRGGGTVFVDAGTTGAAGARYFQAREGVPYSAVVLHFSREERGHLLAADVLQMRGPEGEFTLQRYTLNGELAAETRAPVP